MCHSGSVCRRPPFLTGQVEGLIPSSVAVTAGVQEKGGFRGLRRKAWDDAALLMLANISDIPVFPEQFELGLGRKITA